MKTLEAIAAVISLLNVWLAGKNRLLSWPTGIIAVLLYAGLFYTQKLYAESALQLFYFIMAVYGWWNWKRVRKSHQSGIRSASITLFAVVVVLWIVLSLLVAWVLKHNTDSPFPYFDASMAAGGLLVTWLMARKYIEHWICWIFLDLANSLLFYYREMYITSVLYVLFALLAIYGLNEWKKIKAKASFELQ